MPDSGSSGGGFTHVLQCEEGEQPHDCEGGDEQYRLVLMDEFLQDLGIEGGHLTQH